MKIAMLTNSYKPYVAGVPISIERLVKGLRGLGHEVVVFAPSYQKQEEEEQGIVRVASPIQGIEGGFSVPFCLDPKIEREFRKGKFDLIHVHHPMLMGDVAKHLSRKYRLPLVMTYHTRYEQYLHYIGLAFCKGLMPAYLQLSMCKCSAVIAPTPQIREHLYQIGIKAPVYVLPTGLEAESFALEKQKAELLREKHLQGRQYFFCTVARLAKEKNLDFLLETLARCRQKLCKMGGFKLLLIGEGSYRKHLEKRIGELGLWEEVELTGEVPNEQVKDYCAASDLFLFPSKSETQGIVLLEAMAVGTPVLALKATGTEDVVRNGWNGYMVREEKFETMLMDILEKKELSVLRQGAVCTAGQYREEMIAKKACAIYRAAIADFVSGLANGISEQVAVQ